jgi:hypothetical protein
VARRRMSKRIRKINIGRRDLSARVWRYLSFPGLVSLLETSALHFSDVSAFEDKYDGIFNCLTPDDHYNITEGNIVRVTPSTMDSDAAQNSAQIKELIRGLHRLILRTTGVSCWRIDDQESHAMWRVFLKSDEGVAIETDLTNLTNSVLQGEYQLTVGKIKYIDYTKEKIPIDNYLRNAFFYKNRYFEHEKELRFICHATDGPVEAPPALPNFRPLPEGGLQLPVDLSKLISAIHVSPYAEKWFVDLVVLVAKRYGLNVPVLPSVIALRKKG